MAEYTVEEASLLLRKPIGKVLSWCKKNKTVKFKQRYFLTDADLELLDDEPVDPSLLRRFGERPQTERDGTLPDQVQEETEAQDFEGMGEGSDGAD